MYKVIEGFYDLQDPEGKSFHLYNKGDAYPREGFNPTSERVAELLGSDNKRKTPLIEEEEILVAPAPAAKRTRKK